jgi:phosphoenolpyruvate carboxylase
VNISSDDKELRQSIRQLDSLLTEVLKTQARPETVATVEQLQQRFAGLLSDSSQLGRLYLLETPVLDVA